MAEIIDAINDKSVLVFLIIQNESYCFDRVYGYIINCFYGVKKTKMNNPKNYKWNLM